MLDLMFLMFFREHRFLRTNLAFVKTMLCACSTTPLAHSMRSAHPEPSDGPCLFPVLNINLYALKRKLSQMTVPSDCFLTLAPTTPDNTFPTPRAQVAICAGGFDREAV